MACVGVSLTVRVRVIARVVGVGSRGRRVAPARGTCGCVGGVMRLFRL